MASASELSLQHQLQEKVPAENILSDWLSDLQTSEPSEESCFGFFEFAYNCGLSQYIVEALPSFLDRRLPVHWGVVVEVLAQSGVDYPQEIIQCVLKGAKKQNLTHALTLSRSWDFQRPDILAFRQKKLDELKEQAHQRKEMLLEKLSFLRNQRMVDEEAKLLKNLSLMYPQDMQIVRELEEFQDRWARHLLSSRGGQRVASWTNTAPVLSEEEKQWVLTLLAEMKKISDEKNAVAYDFAVGLHMMGLSVEGLQILEMAPESASKNWLQLELLLQSRRFIEALTLSQELEARYSSDPETAFACHYVRAQALKGLGQHAQAIELLRNMINIRPSYRSAHSLLTAWVEEGA